MASPIAEKQNYSIRCPQCFKLYSVVQKNSKSHFLCQVCQAQFQINFNSPENGVLKTQGLALPQISKVSGAAEGFKKCSECQAQNPRSSTECYKCHRVFDRVEGLTAELKQLGALPSLMKAWQDLMNNYDQVQKHLSFVDQCEDLHALPFALRKYQELKQAQPHDPTAKTMWQNVFFRTLKKKAKSLNWKRGLKLAPLILGCSFIFIGFVNPAQRNMIGFGLSILLFTLGFYYLTRGRIHLGDFLD